MMKTSQVAETLNISSKAVLSIAKKINITPGKNEHGHYVFTEEDVLRLSEYVPQVPKRMGVTSTPIQNEDNKINERLDTLEQSLRSFNYETMQYQLLQHRRELEELREENISLQSQIDDLKRLVISTQQTPTVEEQKRKSSFISSFFGSRVKTT